MGNYKCCFMYWYKCECVLRSNHKVYFPKFLFSFYSPLLCNTPTGVSNTAFSQLMEFTYTATLAVAGEEEAYDVWKAAEYLQMQEAIKALDNK